MAERSRPYAHYWKASTWRSLLGFGDADGRRRKVMYYLFIVSAIVALLAGMALLNAYLRLIDVTSYELGQGALSSPYLLAGYLGMFLVILLSPIPDYLIVPAYGYLAALGVFDPYLTFLVCLAGAIVPVGYLPGRFAGRPLLLKGISYFGISERSLLSAERWIEEHGRFSIFLSTFIPFFYTVASIAAGVLKMSAVKFMLASVAGYGLRFAVLVFIGYSSIFIFTATFDYEQRYLIALILVLSSIYCAWYLFERRRSDRSSRAEQSS